MPPADACQALVLNADYRPLSYFPLSVWSWQDSIKAVFLDRVSIVSEYDTIVRSARRAMRLPSVIALKDYVAGERKPAFTRFNVFLRDRFTCQYCGVTFPTPDLTFDHVVPRAKGGRTSWANVVTACGCCNLRKGAQDLHRCGLRLRTPPRQPSSFELQANGRAFPPHFLHQSWRDYLYWDSPLEN